MKRILFTSAIIPTIAFAAAAEGAGTDPAPAPAEPKVERQRQNGFTRPLSGTKTGLVWDIADAISAKMKRPALRDEVMTEYKEQVKDAMDGTISTQYSRWCGFHGVQDILRKMRAEEKAAAVAAKAEEKAAKDAEKAEKAAAKKAAAAEKKAKATAAKAEKAEKAAAAKAEKEAAKAAKAAETADA